MIFQLLRKIFIVKKILAGFCLALVTVATLASCERRYYRDHHDHSARWHRHHRSGVDINIHT